MENAAPLVISISRQKGCGGAYLGQRLARALGIKYLDRELVAEIAQKLDAPIELVEAYDERVPPVWESILESFTWSGTWMYNPPAIPNPALQVSQMVTEAIIRAAAEESAVFVGRGASYLLRDHPKHISILLYAEIPWRVERTQQIYGFTRQEAAALIAKTDNERSRYKKAISGLSAADVTQYHLAFDTGILGLEKAEALILHYIISRYPDVVPVDNNK